MSIRISLAQRFVVLAHRVDNWCVAEEGNDEHFQMLNLFVQLCELGDQINTLSQDDALGQPRVEAIIEELNQIDKECADIVQRL